MKKHYFLLAILVIITGTLPSCKKGENDPALSLLSRKARLVGDWELISGSLNTVYSDGNTIITTYNGSEKITVTNGTTTSTIAYTKKFSIFKDGSFTKSNTEENDIFSSEGAWYFCPKNKELDLKSKEAVAFSTTKQFYSLNGGPQHEITMEGTHAVAYPEVMQIDRLTKKELVILVDDYYGTESGHYTTTGTMTYKKM
ncbi:MAG TPA: hypothetical protein PKL96_00925 [Bacteroidales bacterium]|nr:hypothetical protein [Bacteroidales bacterium]HPS27708.1 hypothetical protein [Bacteroidales bacterium]